MTAKKAHGVLLFGRTNPAVIARAVADAGSIAQPQIIHANNFLPDNYVHDMFFFIADFSHAV